MEEKKCPICGLVVTGDVIQHLTSKEHEAALKVLLEKEAAQQGVQRTGGESGQQNLFSAGDVLPAKVTRQSTRR